MAYDFEMSVGRSGEGHKKGAVRVVEPPAFLEGKRKLVWETMYDAAQSLVRCERVGGELARRLNLEYLTASAKLARLAGDEKEAAHFEETRRMLKESR